MRLVILDITAGKTPSPEEDGLDIVSNPNPIFSVVCPRAGRLTKRVPFTVEIELPLQLYRICRPERLALSLDLLAIAACLIENVRSRRQWFGL